MELIYLGGRKRAVATCLNGSVGGEVLPPSAAKRSGRKPAQVAEQASEASDFIFDYGAARGLRCLAANITEYGPQFLEYAAHALHDVMLITETHVGAAGLAEMEFEMDQRGWVSFSTPAQPTGRSEHGMAGGAAVFVRKHIARLSIDRLETTSGLDWARATVRLKGG